MSAAQIIGPGQRPACVVCSRAFGRHRILIAELLGSDGAVCDQCWHLNGGAQAIRDRLQHDPDAPLLDFDPRAEARLVQANPHDLLHPYDRVAVESGIRWSTLRTIIPRDRIRLVAKIDERTETVPLHTKLPTGAVDWMGLVTTAIAADHEEFRQPRGSKRRRWWRICRVFALVADRPGRRPLTWAAHEIVAEAVGCSTKTVQRCLRWLEKRGLLHEVVPGCVLRRCQDPQAETPEQTIARQKREVEAEAEAILVAEARRLRIHAELAAVRAGHGGQAALDAATDMLLDRPELPGDPLLDVDLDHRPVDRRVPLWDKHPEQWVRITPVYELRVPLSDPEREEAERIAAACTPAPPSPGRLLAEQHRHAWLHPTNAQQQHDAVLITHDGACGLVDSTVDPDALLAAIDAVTSRNAVALVRTSSFVHPPQVWNLEEIKSRIPSLWINGRAPRDSLKEEVRNPSDVSAHTETFEANEKTVKGPVNPVPEARQCARWLLRSALDPVLLDRVDLEAFEPVLAAAIAGAGLLRHDWTWVDLRDEIHGLPEHPHLPRWVRNGREWIMAHIRDAQPQFPPTKRRVILAVERGSKFFSEHRDRLREAERNARRAAIDACPLCDHNGILDLGEGVPKVRCTHEAESGGW